MPDSIATPVRGRHPDPEVHAGNVRRRTTAQQIAFDKRAVRVICRKVGERTDQELCQRRRLMIESGTGRYSMSVWACHPFLPCLGCDGI